MIPKTWKDVFGDGITSTAAEIADCLNSVLDADGLPGATDPASYNLPSDYIYSEQPFGTFFYKLYDKMDYTSAQNTCTQDGAVLLVPRSIEENEFFGMLGRENNKHIWLGINDIVDEGQFVDNDGIPISFQHWNTGQPDNVGDEDAVELQSSEDHAIGFKWNDIRESSTNAAPLCVFYL